MLISAVQQSDPVIHTHTHTHTFFFLFFSIMVQMVKCLPVVWETQVQSLGQEDPLEKESTPVFLPGKSRGWGNLTGYSSWGCKELDTTKQTHFHFHGLLQDFGYIELAKKVH